MAKSPGLLALMLLTDARRWPGRPRRRSDSARRAGSNALGPCGHRGRHRARHRDASQGAVGLVSAAGRDRRGARRGRAPKTPTGRRSSRCIRCSTGCPTTRWCAQLRDRRGDGPRPRRRSRTAEGTRRGQRAWRATIGSTRSVHTSSRWPATPTAIAHYGGGAARTTKIPERDYLAGKAARLSQNDDRSS